MENIVKYLLYVFIPILVIFAMSHNAFATDISISATPTGAGQVCINGYNVVDLSQVCGLIQNSNSDTVGTVGYIEPTIAGNYYSDSVIQLDFTIYRFSNNQSTHAVVNGIQHDNTVNSGWSLIGYEYENLNTGTGKLKLLFKHNVNSGAFRVRLRGNNGGWIFGLQPGDRVAGINYTVYAINNANAGSQQIVDAINSMPNYSNNLNQINNSINNVNNGINDIKDHNDKEEQAVEDIENQSTDDVDVGDQSSMTNAVGIVSGIFTQIGSVEATDCIIPADFGNLNLGNLNLCTGRDKFPFIINFVSSVFTFVMVVGTMLILVKQIIGLYDWARSD